MKVNTKLNQASGPIAALNAAVAMQCARADLAVIRATCTAASVTLTVEGSFDSTDGVNGTWFTMAVAASNATNLYTQVATIALTAAPTIFWTCRTSGVQWIRARASAFTSATALVVTLSSHNSEL